MKKERTLKAHSYIYMILILVAVGLFFVSTAIDFLEFLMLPAIGLLFYAVWYRNKHIRCPHCNNPLWGLKLVPKKCPGCKRELT